MGVVYKARQEGTARKASHLLRDEGQQKRGGAAPAAGAGAELDSQSLLAQVCSREPSPELATQMTEEYERLLRLLPDDKLRQLARWLMEGHTVKEVAERLGCAARTVKRQLQLIRLLWESERPG
jgi:DNA-directed RNA polymerase specialized sigma24 family protein